VFVRSKGCFLSHNWAYAGEENTFLEDHVPIKLLVIDEDITTLEVIKDNLAPEMYEVHAVSPDQQGVQAVHEVLPDVIIIDQASSDRQPWRLIQEIRTFSQTPILILSVNNKPGMIAKALDAGADDYLVKPVTINVLNARLNNILRRIYPEMQAQFVNGRGTTVNLI
jgi:two-component system KDP operon response regulator KdpE